MQIVERTHIGKVRQSNQDFVQCFISQSGQTLCLVCDGMGGHSAGDVASKMAVVHFGHTWENAEIQEGNLASWISTQIKKENQRILEKSEKYKGLESMGTTMVGAVETETGWLIFNIGDSRAYLFSKEKLQQITSDHSFVNELVRRGELTREEAAHHPKKNIVTRSLGVDEVSEADFFEIEYNETNILLLCSDGLTNMLEDQRIEEILSQLSSLERKADILLEEALTAGGKDNISIVLIKKNGGDKHDGVR